MPALVCVSCDRFLPVSIKTLLVLAASPYLAIHVAMHVEFASHVGFAGRTMAVAELISRSDDHHP